MFPSLWQICFYGHVETLNHVVTMFIFSDVPQLMAQHEKELEDLADKLENEKNRQMLALRERLANRRTRKLDDLRRRQDVDRSKELLEQKKELDGVRLGKAREAEREAIRDGIRDNGEEDSDRVIKAVLAHRHAQVSTAYRAPASTLLQGN